MATIRSRGSRWQAAVKRKGHPTIYQSFDLKKDAEKWARQQERLIDVGRWVDRSEAEQTTFGELLDRYAREISIDKRGVDVELIRINALKRSSIARLSVSAITGQVIAAWRDTRLKEVSPSTVAREFQLLSHVFTVAIREWAFPLPVNPVSMARKPRSAAPRDKVLTDEQRKALLFEVGQCQNQWVKAVVSFALETAARRGEILSLRWQDVDLRSRVATVRGKTGHRKIPLSPACVAMLRTLPRNIDGVVFPVTIDTLKKAYSRAVNRAGIDGFTFHDLRHDALTQLAKLGLNILELRAISGHSTANMLQRYVSVDAADLAAKLERAAR